MNDLSPQKHVSSGNLGAEQERAQIGIDREQLRMLESELEEVVIQMTKRGGNAYKAVLEKFDGTPRGKMNLTDQDILLWALKNIPRDILQLDIINAVEKVGVSDPEVASQLFEYGQRFTRTYINSLLNPSEKVH